MTNHKHSREIPSHILKILLEVSRGDSCGDILLKNVKRLDLISGGYDVTNISILGEWIAGVGTHYTSGKNIIDCKGLTVVPGFIDAHLHLESSIMNPLEFQRVTLSRGVTSFISDPHEIVNVLGKEGLDWMVRCSEMMDQNMFIQIPSCVPSLEEVETNGGEFTKDDMLAYINHPHVLGLGEMMNFPGVISGEEAVLRKIELFSHMHLDGHCPSSDEKVLNPYRLAGIENCHESVTVEEALAKLNVGMSVMIREGSVAKNLDALAGAINEFNSIHCMLCTDDRNPLEINEEGHLDFLIRRLINNHKLAPHIVYRMSSLSAAKHYGLKRLGLIAPGYKADLVLLKDTENVDIEKVYIGGKAVREDQKEKEVLEESFRRTIPPLKNSINRHWVDKVDFHIEMSDEVYNVIEIIPNEIITNHKKVKFSQEKSRFDLEDIVKISVVERYGNQNQMKFGFVKGLEMTNGALASSVAHDSHNIIVAGTSDKDMEVAVNTLIESGGGMVVVSEENILSHLPLEIAGLMSCKSSEEISLKLKKLNDCYKNLGGTLKNPFLQMAFLALPVLPSLRITDKGLFSVEEFRFIDLCH